MMLTSERFIAPSDALHLLATCRVIVRRLSTLAWRALSAASRLTLGLSGTRASAGPQ